MPFHPHQPYQPVYQKGTANSEIRSYHSHHSGSGNSNDASQTFSSPENKAYVSAQSKNSAWKIGWITPLIIIGCYMFAILTAVAHYIYCRFLHQRTVADTIPQSWASAVSITFARVFSLSLVGSASPAFTQLLWWFLRRRSLSLKHIDAMFSLNSSPLKLYILGVLRAVPVLWLFALVFPLIPVATIFPPGSLVVDMRPPSQPATISLSVPNLDLNYRGDGTFADLEKYGMWITATDGVPGSPKLQYNAIGINVLLGNGYLTRSSPCGANCTYDLTFEAPSFHCQDVPKLTFEEMEGRVLGNYPTINQGRFNSEWDPNAADFMAAIIKTNKTILSASTDAYYTFDLSFQNGTNLPMRNISCVLMSGTYIAAVEFLNETQTIDAKIVNEQPLNATALGAGSLFYDAMQQRSGVIDIDRGNSHYNFRTNDDLQYAFRGTQMRIMAEVLLERLGGAISNFGTGESDFTTNTLIKDTPFALPDSSHSEITFNLSPSILEDMMKNVSISFFNRATNFIDVTATTTPYKLSYVFVKSERLIISYALALGVSLVFITIGFATMLHNGVSASTGGFLQIMCTTTHGESKMNKLARRACLGGESNLPKELLDLKVRFGEVDRHSGQGQRFAAFGTEDETRVLLATNLAAD